MTKDQKLGYRHEPKKVVLPVLCFEDFLERLVDACNTIKGSHKSTGALILLLEDLKLIPGNVPSEDRNQQVLGPILKAVEAAAAHKTMHPSGLRAAELRGWNCFERLRVTPK